MFQKWLKCHFKLNNFIDASENQKSIKLANHDDSSNMVLKIQHPTIQATPQISKNQNSVKIFKFCRKANHNKKIFENVYRNQTYLSPKFQNVPEKWNANEITTDCNQKFQKATKLIISMEFWTPSWTKRFCRTN